MLTPRTPNVPSKPADREWLLSTSETRKLDSPTAKERQYQNLDGDWQQGVNKVLYKDAIKNKVGVPPGTPLIACGETIIMNNLKIV